MLSMVQCEPKRRTVAVLAGESSSSSDGSPSSNTRRNVPRRVSSRRPRMPKTENSTGHCSAKARSETKETRLSSLRCTQSRM